MNKNNIFMTDSELQNRVSRWPSVEKIYTGSNLIAGIDSRGSLHETSKTYFRYDYWNNLVMLAPDKYHEGVVFGLKSDGSCVICKEPFAGALSSEFRFPYTYIGNDAFGNMLSFIHSWQNIVQIAVSGELFLALDKSGSIHVDLYAESYSPFESPEIVQKYIETISSWQDIRTILIADFDIIIAQKNNGELALAGYTDDLYGTFSKKRFEELQKTELVDACFFYGGESKYFAFLDVNGNLHNSRFTESEGQKFTQIVGLDHEFLALRDDGMVISFQGIFGKGVQKWPKMKQIALGRRFNSTQYDDLFLAGLCTD